MEHLTVKPAQFLKNHYIAQKLNFLVQILQESKRGYEEISQLLPDRSIQRTIKSLAVECGQYVSELTCQITTLGGEPQPENNNSDHYSWYQTKSWETSNNEDVLLTCTKRENLIVKAYREVLNDPSLYTSLRSMITYQLNGMLYAFVKVKLLNTTLRY